MVQSRSPMIPETAQVALTVKGSGFCSENSASAVEAKECKLRSSSAPDLSYLPQMVGRGRFLVTNSVTSESYKSVFERIRLGSLLEGRRRALSNDFPVINNCDFVGYTVRLFHVVRREEDRDVPFSA